MTREEEIIELTKRTCDAYRRQEPLEKTCGGFKKCDCKCLQYNRCEMVYNVGWRKQIEAEWIHHPYLDSAGCVVWISFRCSNCNETNGTNYDYCPNCGAKMITKGE